jgi:membrane protein YdbS with pleckstrin-like domain
MSAPRRARPAPAPEVRRVQGATWVTLVVVTVVTAGAFLLDEGANPVVQGLFAVVAALEAMIALFWWRSTRRRDIR